MICRKCGAEIPQGKLYCAVCGQEVQLVPDYNSIEYMTEEKLIREKQEQEKEQQKMKEAEEAEAGRREKLHLGPLFLVLRLTAASAAAAALIFGIYTLVDARNAASPLYQKQIAQEYYEQGNYELALAYADRALAGNPSSLDTALLKSASFAGLSRIEEAAAVLEPFTSDELQNMGLLEQLIPLWERLQKYDQIRDLLKKADGKRVRSRFAAYFSEAPVFSPQPGAYEAGTVITLTVPDPAQTLIYYTTDGSQPTEESEMYKDGIPLPEGSVKIRAVAVNRMGIASDPAEGNYTGEADHINDLQISPSAGEYSEDTRIRVRFPEGYTCWYAFDEDPEEYGEEYTEPLEMPEGEHTFYAVLEDAEGRFGETAEAEYTLTYDEEEEED